MRATRGVKVGSIHPNVFRPFPEAAIVKALAGKRNVIILERTDEPLAGESAGYLEPLRARREGYRGTGTPGVD